MSQRGLETCGIEMSVVARSNGGQEVGTWEVAHRNDLRGRVY